MEVQKIKVGRYYTDKYLGVVKVLEVNPIEDNLRIEPLEDKTYGLIVNEKGGYLFSLGMGAKDLKESSSMRERMANGLLDALVSKGKNKGMLKKQCPPMNTVGSAVWQAIVGFSNPYKIGFGHMMFMDEGNRELYDYVVQLGKHIDLTTFDTDSNALKNLGVW